jgi:hypothetical protein
MSCNLLRTLMAGGFALCAASLAQAAVLVNDTWRDGTDDDPAAPVYSEYGADADADGDLESVWYQGGGGTLNPAGMGGPLVGTVTGSSSSWTTYFSPEATPVTLASAGDKLRVTWVFTPIGVNAGNTSQDFRLAVVDSPSAARLAANGSPGSSTYSGYAMFMNMGPTLGNSNPFQLREHDNNGALLSGSGDWLALANGVPTNAAGYTSGTQYTYTMEITRTAAGELDILSTMVGGTLNGSGTASVSFLDTTPNGGSYSFDTFAVRPSSNTGTASQFDTSLFRVEFIPIPEPASAGLMGVAVAALFAARRR